MLSFLMFYTCLVPGSCFCCCCLLLFVVVVYFALVVVVVSVFQVTDNMIYLKILIVDYDMTMSQ